MKTVETIDAYVLKSSLEVSFFKISITRVLET